MGRLDGPWRRKEVTSTSLLHSDLSSDVIEHPEADLCPSLRSIHWSVSQQLLVCVSYTKNICTYATVALSLCPNSKRKIDCIYQLIWQKQIVVVNEYKYGPLPLRLHQTKIIKIYFLLYFLPVHPFTFSHWPFSIILHYVFTITVQFKQVQSLSEWVCWPPGF